MHRATDSYDHNDVSVNDKGVIVISVKGPQTRETMRDIGKKVQELAGKKRARGERVFIFTDISGLSLASTSSSARQEARTVLANVSFDGAAVFGQGAWMALIMYLTRVTGAKGIRFFTNKRAAEAWINHEIKPKEARQSAVGIWTGLVLMAIGIVTLMGWQLHNGILMSWIPGLRPMNPMSAVGIMIIGLGFATYWARKVLWLRIGGMVTILIGVFALSPISIDYILYGGQVLALGPHAQIADSAALCFIAMGIVPLIAGRTQWWVRPLEYIAAAVLGGLSLLNIFGQLYAHDWLYGIGSNFVMAFNLAVAFLITTIALVILVLYRQLGENVLTRISRTGWLIVVVFVLLQAATYGSWVQTVARNQAESSSAFMASARSVRNTLQGRFDAYTNALYGFQGLFIASNSVSQGEFENYYDMTNVAKHYPGLRALSFISKVTDKELPAFIARTKTDTSLNPKGNPTFSISQLSHSPTHYIVTYVSGSAAASGTDLTNNPDRLAAFQQAESTKQLVASGTITFAATATTPAQDGFFITAPVAYESDPNRIIGFVNTVFDYQSFFADTFNGSVSLDGMNVSMTDTSDNKIVYNAQNTKGQATTFSYEVPITVASRTWNLQVNAPAGFGSTQKGLPGAVLFAGQTLSALLVIIFLIQARGRQQALNLADDITKDLQEERNHAVANDQKSTAILASIGDGVFAVDIRGHITVFNPAAQAISGMDEKEALGRPHDEVLRFVSEKTGKTSNSFIKHALDGYSGSMAEHTELIRSDGKHVPVADSAAPIRDANDKIIGAIIVFRDVSKEEELDKAKSEFVSLASHQLRTPLSAINWYSEMLLSEDAGKLNKDQHEYIKEIFEGSQRMVELVNSLLNVSRIEVGKLVTQPAPNTMSEVIDSLEKELEVSVKSKKLTVHKHIERVPTVIADPKQIRMIVQNLMSNAVKYTAEKGSVEITLRVATAGDMKKAGISKPGNFWFLSVADNGYGIPKEQQSKIFGKMFRADNVRKLDVEGTGLGLYIVKEVVEKMGGKVWFESMESAGTTFYIVAPIEVKHVKT